MSAATGTAGATALYVYGVTDAERARLGRGVDARFEVELFDSGEDRPAAIVSGVELADFATDEPGGRDVAWIGEKALAHDAVLERALAAGCTVVPFRFGTVVRSADDLAELLRERRAGLAAAIARVRGRVEVGVKGSLERVALERLVASRSVESRLPDGDRGSGPGAAYLRRKQLDRTLGKEVEREARSRADEVHAALGAVADDACANPLRAVEAAGRLPILNGAYLLRAERRELFDRLVATLERAHAEAGLRLEPTGPWPPYNFVPHDLGGR